MGIFHLFFGFSGRINRGKLVDAGDLAADLDRRHRGVSAGRSGHFRQELTGWFAAGPRRLRRILAYGSGLRRSIPHYSRIADRELGFSAGDRRQAAARPGPERMVDCFVVLRAYGSPSCATVH